MKLFCRSWWICPGNKRSDFFRVALLFYCHVTSNCHPSFTLQQHISHPFVHVVGRVFRSFARLAIPANHSFDIKKRQKRACVYLYSISARVSVAVAGSAAHYLHLYYGFVTSECVWNVRKILDFTSLVEKRNCCCCSLSCSVVRGALSGARSLIAG